MVQYKHIVIFYDHQTNERTSPSWGWKSYIPLNQESE